MPIYGAYPNLTKKFLKLTQEICPNLGYLSISLSLTLYPNVKKLLVSGGQLKTNEMETS